MSHSERSKNLEQSNCEWAIGPFLNTSSRMTLAEAEHERNELPDSPLTNFHVGVTRDLVWSRVGRDYCAWQAAQPLPGSVVQIGPLPTRHLSLIEQVGTKSRALALVALTLRGFAVDHHPADFLLLLVQHCQSVWQI